METAKTKSKMDRKIVKTAKKPLAAKQAGRAYPAEVKAPAKVPVTFRLPEFQANDVALCGDFNNWSPSTNPMKRQAEGCWEATVDLRPGRYHYKFIVDGEWIPDPLAEENILNEHGTLNSVIEVSA